MWPVEREERWTLGAVCGESRTHGSEGGGERREASTYPTYINADGIVTRGPWDMLGKDLSWMYVRPAQPQSPPPPPPPPVQPTRPPTALEQAYAVFYVQPGAPLAIVEAAYKAAMKTAHPDVGGSNDEARRLTQAIDIIRTSTQNTQF